MTQADAMNHLLQELREWAQAPLTLQRQAAFWHGLSTHLTQGWIIVAIDYAHEHGLLTAHHATCLKRQHQAIMSGSSWKNPIDQTELVWIPASPQPHANYRDKRGRSRKAHPIFTKYITQLDGYALARHPITNRQYARFVEETGYKSPLRTHWFSYDGEESDEPKSASLKHWEGERYPLDQADHPVVYISWFDAEMYCRWAGLVLPTMFMWQKAALGTDGRIFPWGDQTPDEDAPQLAHLKQGGTCSVFEYRHVRTAYGCHNMVGNVSEMCAATPEGTADLQMPLLRPDLSFVGNYYKRVPCLGGNYGGFVSTCQKIRQPHLVDCRHFHGTNHTRNVARHSPWCGFRPAFLPAWDDPNACHEIHFDAFDEVLAHKRARESVHYTYQHELTESQYNYTGYDDEDIPF